MRNCGPQDTRLRLTLSKHCLSLKLVHYPWAEAPIKRLGFAIMPDQYCWTHVRKIIPFSWKLSAVIPSVHSCLRLPRTKSLFNELFKRGKKAASTLLAINIGGVQDHLIWKFHVRLDPPVSGQTTPLSRNEQKKKLFWPFEGLAPKEKGFSG
ncbi:hypothetical protein ABW19_dt0202947 [Dactylella cylindrospora]|nr:hypothetical protein ABW19_dt0202947 [Dactylella cylindrospora]